VITPDTRAVEHELRKTLELEMLKSINLLVSNGDRFCYLSLILIKLSDILTCVCTLDNELEVLEFSFNLKIQKGLSEAVNLIRTDNTIATRKKKGVGGRQTMIYKTLHRKLKITLHELYEKHVVNPSACFCSCFQNFGIDKLYPF
jgi:hypothetical protein